MALSIPQSFHMRHLKDGARSYKGLDEAVTRNIEACSELGSQLKTAFGPNGMNKLLVNDIGKEFITTDAATIIHEIAVQHPAAKLLAMAADYMQNGPGDYVNTSIILATELLTGAAELINSGIKTVEIIESYQRMGETLMSQLSHFVIAQAKDLHKVEEVKKYIFSPIMAKQLIHADFISGIVAKACVQTASKSNGFNVDNIRIVKLPGGTVKDSVVINGMVFNRSSETDVRSVEAARVALFACPFDITQTETKGTVLMSNATELMEFSSNEEKEVEKQVRELHEAGVNVVVAAGKFGDLYNHYLNKYGIMGVRLVSKFDLRRLCRMLCAPAQANICVPSLEHIGQCDKVYQHELSGHAVIVFEKTGQVGAIASIVVRGPTTLQLNDMERAIDDGINTYKSLTRDSNLVAGAGAFEIEINRYIEFLASTNSTVEQFILRKFGLAFESIPKQLARNAGLNATETLAALYTEHKKKNTTAGVDINQSGKVIDAQQFNLFDAFLPKKIAIQVAVDVACQILSVDQIIMAKLAGGPNTNAARPQDPEGNDDGMA
uniref:T-complex protein 1 subunit theta n=1 Tax=Panagrolaimus superbus TaxID=310955 RepID=A0A914Z1X8_9BILA